MTSRRNFLQSIAAAGAAMSPGGIVIPSKITDEPLHTEIDAIGGRVHCMCPAEFVISRIPDSYLFEIKQVVHANIPGLGDATIKMEEKLHEMDFGLVGRVDTVTLNGFWMNVEIDT